jgi:hypothetical protein
MSKAFKSSRKTVELTPAPKPSRIRREPAPADAALVRKLERIDWRSPEWEQRVVVIGVILFAVALFVILLGTSEITSH